MHPDRDLSDYNGFLYVPSYIKQYKRQYQDSTEEAVRKNLLMQSNRFAASGNRVGATFAMGATPLADRLLEELRALTGAQERRERLPSEPFPLTRAQTRDLHDDLPAEFDWRERGGVTHVRRQCPLHMPPSGSPWALYPNNIMRSTP